MNHPHTTDGLKHLIQIEITVLNQTLICQAFGNYEEYLKQFTAINK